MECDAFHGLYLSDKIPEDAFHGQALKTVAYLRVSTAQQDLRSQRLAILEYARKHEFRIDYFIKATASASFTLIGGPRCGSGSPNAARVSNSMLPSISGSAVCDG